MANSLSPPRFCQIPGCKRTHGQGVSGQRNGGREVGDLNDHVNAVDIYVSESVMLNHSES